MSREEHTLNADPQEQMVLLEVQGYDLELDRLAHRRAHLPEVARVRELQVRDRALADDLTEVAVEVDDLEGEQRKADADVDLVRQRSEKDRQLLDSGTIHDAKQLVNLQHELESLARRQSDLEDIELEVMERLEQAQHRRDALMSERAELQTEIAEATAARDAALEAIAAEEAAVAAARASIVGGVPADLMTLYDKLRADHDGIGAAALRRGRCEGCRMELTPVDLERIRSAPDGEVLRCEECRRILVRTPESGL